MHQPEVNFINSPQSILAVNVYRGRINAFEIGDRRITTTGPQFPQNIEGRFSFRFERLTVREPRERDQALPPPQRCTAQKQTTDEITKFLNKKAAQLILKSRLFF